MTIIFRFSTLLSLILFLALFSVAQNKQLKPGNIELKKGWSLQQSGKIKGEGASISSPGISTKGWYSAEVPGTVMGNLTRNGLYHDIFMGKNYQDIDKTPFDDSWWYRKEFRINEKYQEEQVILRFDGLNYYANIWLNGKQIASSDSIFGPFRRYELNVTSLVRKGINVLAVEVSKAKPGDFNIGFVDWNPRPTDENMGIWRGVYLETTGPVILENNHVQPSLNIQTLKEADLTISTEIHNLSPKKRNCLLKGKIGKIEFSFPVNLKPLETRIISLDPSNIPALKILNPRIWWCNNLGTPELYHLELSLLTNEQLSDQRSVTFGIRDIQSYVNEHGYKGFKLNGKEVLIKGAGWADDIFLRDSSASLEIQVQYVKHMNLNTIRFEGFWGNSSEIYDLCDKYGILAMVGWSCHWEWDEYLGKACDEFGGIQSKEDMGLAINSFRDQLLWLRNHPSIFVWFVGSDKCPRPELEKQYAGMISSLDNRPYLSAASTRKSEVSGPTGVKMNGPYEYVAPNYWYTDTINGGAFGFNTETGPGPQVPVLESVRKMIPADKLWPLNDTWNYHCTHSKQAFNTMNVFNDALTARYGKPASLDDYLVKSDMQGYEALKAMFEAFRSRIPKTTGIIQWMLNSAWPSLFWQLYDYNLLPTSAYYAAKKANEPIQLVYDYGSGEIYLVNESPLHAEGDGVVKASMTWLNAQSHEIIRKDVDVALRYNTSSLIYKPGFIKGASFLSLVITDKTGKRISDNFYWLSDKKDEYAWDKTFWAYTPMKDYADYSALSSMPAAKLGTSCKKSLKGKEQVLDVQLENPGSNVAFFCHLELKNDKGELIYPLFWDDNFFSLMPGEKRSIKCLVPQGSLKGSEPRLTISGWNISNQKIEIL
ncbi:MAG: beta galactosidase jelly roll domain-containing protein [Bacteroidetes bacterium]|nr:beta galactosidase jelly roll domain-containing protein [Bacteroidota bacterium]